MLLDAGGGPTDVYGEIAIQSPHVALGYWRDEEKSGAAFGVAAGRCWPTSVSDGGHGSPAA